MYYNVWKNFNSFFIRLDNKPTDWEDRLVLYVGFLIDNNRKSATIKSYISAIKLVLLENDNELNEDRFLLNSLTRACKLKNDFVKNRFPIRRMLLDVVLQETSKYFEQEGQVYLSCLYRAIFASAYYRLLRIGEVTSGDHPVLAKDVRVGENKEKLLFILRSSKTYEKSKKPQLVKISGAIKMKKFCPFRFIQEFIAIRPCRKTNTEVFYIFRDRSPVRPHHARRILKLMLSIAGFKPQLYDTHSLRIRHCVDLLQMGISVETIKKLGRWKSNCIFTYLSHM